MLCSLLGACSGALRVPARVATTPALPVVRSGSWNEKEVRLGDVALTRVERENNRSTGRGVVNFDRSFDEGRVGFQFQEGGLLLAGDCLERLKSNMMGLKRPLVLLHCRCRDGDEVRAELELEQYQGHARLSDAASYQVSSLHETTRGHKKSEVLGYWFRGPNGEGAVDVQGAERVWLPPGASSEEKSLLMCLYGALILYRPSEAF
jgi:hypothetical protein